VCMSDMSVILYSDVFRGTKNTFIQKSRFAVLVAERERQRERETKKTKEIERKRK